MEKTIVVTGASSGLGYATAEHLARCGYIVYAGARSFQDPTATAPAGCIPLYLDVTDPSSIDGFFRHIAEDGRVPFGLINCAAFLSIAPCESIDLQEFSTLMDTNFLGMVRMVQRALPLMRASGGGRIVNFSSINGRLAIPFQGAYSASKFAVEGWSEALSQEVGRFGIAVTLIEPGDCRGGSDRYRHVQNESGASPSVYDRALRAAAEKIREDERSGLERICVAKAVKRVLEQKRPPFRVIVANLTERSSVWLKTLLPHRSFEKMLVKYYSPKKKQIDK